MGTIVTEQFIKWQKREHNADQIKNTNPFENIVRFVASDVAEGIYKFHWYCEVRNEVPTNSVIVVRAQVKGNVVGTHQFEIPQLTFQSFAGWDFVQLGKRENPVVLLEWRRLPGGNNDIVVRNARISIEFMEGEPGARGSGGGQGRGLEGSNTGGI